MNQVTPEYLFAKIGRLVVENEVLVDRLRELETQLREAEESKPKPKPRSKPGAKRTKK